jgi:hypothetical protein
LPGDTTAVTGVVRVVIAVGLVAAPVWMLLRLGNFVADWSRVRELGADSRMWEDAASSVGGVAQSERPGEELAPITAWVELYTADINAAATVLAWAHA